MNPETQDVVDKTQDIVTEPQAQENTAQQEQETAQQINWRKFREAREVERKRLEELERENKRKEREAEALKAALDSVLNKASPAHEEDEDEEKKVERKLEELLEKRERQREEERRKKELQEIPQRLQQTYSDFNQVCSQENLDYLEFHYPEIATAFAHMPDSIDKWASVYKAVKRFIPNVESKKDVAKMERNLSKPQSMATAGVTQTGDHAPIYLDEKRKAENWARMQRAMKGM